MENLVLISVAMLDDHEKNPRVVLRADVVSGIEAQLREDGFKPQYALHVRKIGSRYQILSGHHRKQAAINAGIESVWCWVDDLDDDTAFMALVTSNAQGELDPLEIGIHAFEAVPVSKGGRGKKGGLSEYAEKIGKKQQYLSQIRDAGEVAANLQVDLYLFLGKAQHLAAIHQADRTIWPMLCQKLIEKKWSVDETRDVVTKSKGFLDAVPHDRYPGWLPFAVVFERYIDTREFAPVTVENLVKQADYTIAMITNKLKEPGEKIAEFEAWLVAKSGRVSWDVRKLKERHQEIENELDKQHETTWNHGPWQDFVGGLEDGSVSLLLTDPPYGMDYQSDYRLDRSKLRKHEKITNDGADAAVDELQACLVAMASKLKSDAHVLVFCHWSNEPEIRQAVEQAGLKIRGSLIWAKNNTGMGDPSTTFAPKHERIIHAVKGSPVLFERQADVLEFSRVQTDRHPTEKPVSLLCRLIEITTVKGELVADPFGGVASTLVAAVSLKRAGWGCEMSQKYWEAGNERIQ